MIKRPMLAEKVSVPELAKLTYPLIATPKLDGIRCLIINGKAVTRKFLPIPNNYVRTTLEAAGLPDNLDGELMLRKGGWGDVSSAFMSHDGEPDFVFCVFDLVTRDGGLEEPYMYRLDTLELWCKKYAPPFVKYVKPTWISNAEELERYESVAVETGYEGIMVRSPNGPYKCNRSTVREGYLLKVKRFEDDEAVIVGFDEAEKNTNEAKRGKVGEVKRSQAKAGKVGKGTLGAFVVKGLKGRWKGVEFRVGTGRGLSAPLKALVWGNQDKYLGKIIKYKYQPIGSKDAPRIPSFQGFRDRRDF